MRKLLFLLLPLLLTTAHAQVAIGGGVQVGNSSATGNPYDISNQFAPGEVQLLNHDEIVTAAGATSTVEDITGHSGTVTSFQIDADLDSGTGSVNDTVINIYIDGSSTPSITFDLGVLGTGYGGTNGTAYADDGASVGFYGSNSMQWVLKYPIYFSTEFKATLTSPSTGGIRWFDETRYTTEYTSGLRLKSTNTTYVNAVSTNLATTPFVFLNLASGSGTIAALFIGTSGATNYTYLEAGMFAYMDGATTAQYQDGGGEDFAGSGWYFDGPATYQNRWSYLSAVNSSQYALTFNVDMLTLHGGLPFRSGVKFDWEKVPSKSTLVTTNVKIAYLCLYYQ